MNDLDLEKYAIPPNLIISPLKWKYLLRSVIRGKNIMVIGHTGTAKTYAVKCVAETLGRELFVINAGSSQDARATLLGNTTYKKEEGTIFYKSSFIRAITTPGTIILLDEFSRGSHDFHNILISCIDPIQKYVRLDEEKDSSKIFVAEGVCFVATTNIGNSYTATKVLDRAILRRFPIKLEMPALTGIQLEHLFGILFRGRTTKEESVMKTLAAISDDLIAQCNMEDPKISTFISAASIIEMAELIMDGFDLQEIAEAAIYPEYPDDGGAGESERVYVKGIIQKHFPSNAKSPINDPLVNRKKAKF
jgi:MoxR-like ATPase